MQTDDKIEVEDLGAILRSIRRHSRAQTAIGFAVIGMLFMGLVWIYCILDRLTTLCYGP